MNNNAVVIGFMVVLLLIVGTVAAGFGVTSSPVTIPAVLEPPTNSGLFDTIFAPFKYVFAALGSVVQLGTFQAAIPAIFAVVFAGLAGYIAILVIGMIRGTKV